jgi:hypothetical protein
MTSIETPTAAFPVRLLLACSLAALVGIAPRRASAEPTGLAFVAHDGAAPSSAPATAQPPAQPADPFLPGAGHVALSLASGIPFAAVGEVAVGTTDWMAVSAIAGIADTGGVSAFGGSLHVAAFRRGRYELMLSVPVLYYPPAAVHDDIPWLLTNPSLVFAYRWDRASVYGGAGALFTTCVGGLAATFGGPPVHDTQPLTHPMVNGAWDTLHLGGAYGLTPRVGLFAQTSLMLSGVEIAQSYAEKVGPPVLALAGVRVVL